MLFIPQQTPPNFGPGTILTERLSMVRAHGRGYVLSWALFALSMAALMEMAATKSDKKAYFSTPLLHRIKVNI